DCKALGAKTEVLLLGRNSQGLLRFRDQCHYHRIGRPVTGIVMSGSLPAEPSKRSIHEPTRLAAIPRTSPSIGLIQRRSRLRPTAFPCPPAGNRRAIPSSRLRGIYVCGRRRQPSRAQELPPAPDAGRDILGRSADESLPGLRFVDR